MSETTYQRLQKACEDAGTNLNYICRVANVDRSVVERWKRKDPKTLRILAAIQAAIAGVSAAPAPAPVPAPAPAPAQAPEPTPAPAQAPAPVQSETEPHSDEWL